MAWCISRLKVLFKPSTKAEQCRPRHSSVRLSSVAALTVDPQLGAVISGDIWWIIPCFERPKSAALFTIRAVAPGSVSRRDNESTLTPRRPIPATPINGIIRPAQLVRLVPNSDISTLRQLA